ncbi:MAG: AbrB/MazE/SpoVT family DNA-binding domain-containing protein [Anaerolineales bacterium]
MDAVTVSPKYQVVIPQKVREQMRVKPGQKMHVIAYDNMVVFILSAQSRKRVGR